MKRLFAEIAILCALFVLVVLASCKSEPPSHRCVREACHLDLVPFPNGDGTITFLPMNRCTCVEWVPNDAGAR